MRVIYMKLFDDDSLPSLKPQIDRKTELSGIPSEEFH